MFGESIGVITFDFSDLEKSTSRSLGFPRRISRQGAELDHYVLLSKHQQEITYGGIHLHHHI